MTRRSLLEGIALPDPDGACHRQMIEIVRNPHNLALHFLRLADAGSPGEVYAALVDLFIGSETTEKEARARALAERGDLLTPAQRDALQAAVEAGLPNHSPVPACPTSLFTSGASGTIPLVVASSDDATAGVQDTTPLAPSTAPAPATAAREDQTGDSPGGRGSSDNHQGTRSHSSRRTPAMAAAVVIAVIVGAVTIGVTLTRPDDPPTPSASPGPTAADPPSPVSAPTTSARPEASAPSQTISAPETVAVSAIDSAFEALDRPSAAWADPLYLPEGAAVSEIQEFRRRLVAAGTSFSTQVTRVEVVDVEAVDGAATVTLEVIHDGTTLLTPEGPAIWVQAGIQAFTVELVARDGRWLVTLIRGSTP